MDINTSFTQLWAFTILFEVASFLPWCTLVQSAHWPDPAPAIAILEIRRRIFALLSPYISSKKKVKALFAMLEDVDGSIVGAVATQLLMGEQDSVHDVVPRLDIVVAGNQFAMIHEFFLDLGYDYTTTSTKSYFKREVESTELLQKTVGGKVIQVQIMSARKSPLSVLMSSPTTAHMNAITPRYIISTHPGITFANKSMPMHHFNGENLDLDAFGSLSLDMYDENDHWTKPCNGYCPMKWRVTTIDEGVAKYPWAYTGDKDGEALEGARGVSPPPFGARWEQGGRNIVLQESVRWKIAPRCFNAHCPVGAVFDELSHFVKI